MAQNAEQQAHVAGVYASALFDLASASGKVDAYLQELDELVKLEDETLDKLEHDAPGYTAFMESAILGPEKRAAVLEKLFRGRLSDDVLNTLLVMNRNGRHGLIAGLHRAFELLSEEAAGEVEVRVTSAVKLSKAQCTDAQKVAAEITGKKPVIEYVVDTNILGGLIVQIGDVRYDNSVRRQLHVARTRLIDRGERGLAITAEAS